MTTALIIALFITSVAGWTCWLLAFRALRKGDAENSRLRIRVAALDGRNMGLVAQMRARGITPEERG